MRASPVRGIPIVKSFGPIKAMFLLNVCLLFAACGVVNNNLSRHEYFAPMVGVNLTLQRKAYLCESTWSGQWPDTKTYSSVDLVHSQNNCFWTEGTIVVELEVGAPVRLNRVYESTEFNASGIIAVGEISGYKFEYIWGARLLPLNLAPWEKGPRDPNRCLGTIWDECNTAKIILPDREQN